MSFHVVIVSSGQPSANPRAVKEAIALLENSYTVTFIYVPISKWADEFDLELMNNYKQISWIKCGYHKETEACAYSLSRLRLKIWNIIFKVFGNWNDSAIKSMVLFSQELRKKASSIKADLYIGHNLGALPAIVTAAHKFNAKSIFDFEDYHRGEFEENSLNQQKVQKIENRYIPLLSGISAASPLIANEYERIFKFPTITVVNNVFHLEYGVSEISYLPNKPIKLFWFSQYIGKNRGLESILEALSNFQPYQVTLTLLGVASNEIREYFISLMDSFNIPKSAVTFLPPVSENIISKIASQHHIGIASEIPHNLNRELCLTNKIFMYLLSGNALLLSNTQSQFQFWEQNQNIGMTYRQGNVNDIILCIKTYLSDPKFLNLQRSNSLKLAREKYNWNIEQKIFFEHINQILTN